MSTIVACYYGDMRQDTDFIFKHADRIEIFLNSFDMC